MSQYVEVGRIAAIHRYPVKSMAGELLDSADVSWYGLTGDRRWAFIRGGMVRSGFPWLTMRENAGMGRYQRAIEDYRRFIALDDRSPRVLYKLAHTYYRNAQAAKAIIMDQVGGIAVRNNGLIYLSDYGVDFKCIWRIRIE